MSTHQRLKAPMGLLIDREKTVSFQFEGATVTGHAGDTLASALAANGQWLLSRSFKYHRPRGPLTMAGQDANTLVQLPDEPNVLSDRQPAESGLQVTGQNYSGSLRNDRDARLDWFGRFMPVGFYYRAFFRPLGSWKYWEKLIRRKAGLGRVNLEVRPDYCDKVYRFHDVVVVGAGPAGLQAALTAADGGADVLLVDENPLAGGALSYHRFDSEGNLADSVRTRLIDDVQAHPLIVLLLSATCNGWFMDNYLPVIQGNRMYKVRARECILATGSFEQLVVFRNNDLPGIMLCSAAQRLMKWYGIAPGQRAVVLTGNDDGYHTALDLQDQGVIVQAIVDLRPASEATDIGQIATEKGLTVLAGSTVYEALADRKRQHLKQVDVRAITGRGTVADASRLIDCDLLCMGSGYMPAYQLACQAGARLDYREERAEFSLTGLPPHLHLAGSVNGVHDLDRVIADGQSAAYTALQSLGLSDAVAEAVTCTRRVNVDWPIFPHPRGKDFVDLDEDLQSKDLVNATKLGYRDIQLVKRFSTVGMGPSQGRHSALPTARLVAAATDRTVSETGVTTARPPFVPERLQVLAGRGFDPFRRTAMHHRHMELGACMIPAGVWQRPGYYGPADRRDACIHAESEQVRQRVGLIDVSTLGGIEVRGPDAAEFINRVYTFGFLKLPIGRTRYAIHTNEQGVVIDDGVASRIAENHFYVTATTTGVDRVYRAMLKWNAQWRLDIDIANVTSAFAAVNLAGPLSRQILARLCNDLDLSAEGFPYLACREGTVAGIPSRLLRVGFVGELGYEIHVPALYGEALWDALMTAGEPEGLRPFGVETQRLLRLEKGHIIIGQDTDGMSHPGELALGWAINRKKPFFLGSRSVDIVMARPQTRRLVGFTLPAGTPKPEEGHLVLRGSDISGHVTSCEYSPSVGSIIGLAYVGTDQAEPGQTVHIRVDGGLEVTATVCTLPFFDPDNKRQEL